MSPHSQTGLHKALTQHKRDIAAQALQRGDWHSEIHRTVSGGLTPLDTAAQEGMFEALLWLVYAGADIDRAQALATASAELAFVGGCSVLHQQRRPKINS
jgi:hypothetical protein